MDLRPVITESDEAVTITGLADVIDLDPRILGLNEHGIFKVFVTVSDGPTDHKYEITAEVTDQSRRTIVGSGNVLVARKPFKVYTWVDRGHYKVGDAIQASFSAQTLDNKPVQGKGNAFHRKG